ncbi:hypothetical protein B7990_14035 [Fibrobacter sp. UWB4]|uniref:hypothetical protein n=1 Tax=Fibrobacter sp. UWB4 TaxID=1964356 RepID=UPI000B527571|nr:hypothetical protein [Fibrobacter sp. UWB4]OWV15328.1 hypothetical protein B7990_14035 [Fibrobacter sp. UWB4]
MNKFIGITAFLAAMFMVSSCAGERQGLVCEEIEYRLNTLSYSPDQRAYMEEELRTCRSEEAKKKSASTESKSSIYERYANTDGTKVDSANVEVPVSKLLQDSSEEKTTSIYDRYKSVEADK